MQKVKMALSPHQVTKKMNGALLQDMAARLSGGVEESSLRRSQLLKHSVLKGKEAEMVPKFSQVY